MQTELARLGRALDPARPPAARIDCVCDAAFDPAAADPYRWMEQPRGEELEAWLRAQAAYSRAYLDGLPQRAALLERIRALGDTSPKLSGLFAAGGRVFYLRRDPGASQARLVVRCGPDAPEQTLVDPAALGPAAIDWYMPSWDGAYVAYGVSAYGSEDSTLYVTEVDGARPLDLAISRTQFGDVYWLHDNRSFVYRRFPERSALPPAEHYYDSQILIHRLGDDPERDRPVFGRAASPGAAVGRADFPTVVISPASEWAVGLVVHGVQQELDIYTAPLAALAGPGPVVWRPVATADDQVTGFDLAGATIYLKTYRGAPNCRVLATRLDAPDLARADEIVPESSAVIEDLLVAGEDLLVRDLEGGAEGVRRFPRGGGAGERLRLPGAGAIVGWAYAAARDELLLQLVSWTEAPRIYRAALRRGAFADTGWCPPSTIDTSGVVAYQIAAAAPDGTAVPISIVHRRGLALDGGNPTLLVGYGSYGISLRPAYSPAMLAFYERGGVYAVAHIRGGGECGPAWHAAALGSRKCTAVDDFICCAETLIACGYTRPARLAAQGTSAGGVPAGVALARRPDLWGAVVIRAGLVNPLRLEACEGGAANIHEFGAADDAEGWRARRAIDAYAQIQDGAPYPAVLLTASLHDARVPLWQSAKLAARLQAASASERPVLLRIDFEGGHGIGASRSQEDEELADRLAFLLAQLG